MKTSNTVLVHLLGWLAIVLTILQMLGIAPWQLITSSNY